VELLHSQALGPELRKAVCHARSLGTTWTYLEDHLREQRERIDRLLSETLKTEEPSARRNCIATTGRSASSWTRKKGKALSAAT
jgi:hypothetical protein